MKRARDVRDQLEGLMDRVEIEKTTNVQEHDAIRKAIAAGFFYHTAKLQKSGSYRTVKNSMTVDIHPSSGLAKAEVGFIFACPHFASRLSHANCLLCLLVEEVKSSSTF